MKLLYEDNQPSLKRAIYEQGETYFELCYFPDVQELEVRSGTSIWDDDTGGMHIPLFDRRGIEHRPRGPVVTGNTVVPLIIDRPWAEIAADHASYFMRLALR